MTTSIEERLRAHFADRAEREHLPGPEADTEVQRALRAGGRGRRPVAAWSGRGRLALAAAAVVVAAAAVAGTVVLRDHEPTVVTDDTTTTEPEPGPTTTAPPTTETTTPSSTTSAPPRSGDAATGPIVASAGVLGTWSGSAWVPWDRTRTPPDGEAFQVVGLAGPVVTRVGAVEVGCDVSGEVETIDLGLASGVARGEPAPIAVRGVAAPRPRPVTVLDPATPGYREVTVAVLADLGITDAQPGIRQIVRGDLDGDGADEAVVVAERVADPDGPYGRPGDYSVVFLRRLVGGEVETTVVEQSIADEALGDSGNYFIEAWRVAALADLNGDGRMEIAVDGTYYEGGGTVIHDLRPDGTVPEVLSAYCGA